MLTLSENCGIRRGCIQNGKGECTIKNLASKETMYDHARFFAHVTIPVGCSIGDHPHVNETEFYYILKGKGRFNDNGVETIVSAGDVCATGYGEVHGIENVGEDDLEMIALIVLEK